MILNKRLTDHIQYKNTYVNRSVTLNDIQPYPMGKDEQCHWKIHLCPCTQTFISNKHIDTGMGSSIVSKGVTGWNFRNCSVFLSLKGKQFCLI